jgi:hypothetical protein
LGEKLPERNRYDYLQLVVQTFEEKKNLTKNNYAEAGVDQVWKSAKKDDFDYMIQCETQLAVYESLILDLSKQAHWQKVDWEKNK